MLITGITEATFPDFLDSKQRETQTNYHKMSAFKGRSTQERKVQVEYTQYWYNGKPILKPNPLRIRAIESKKVGSCTSKIVVRKFTGSDELEVKYYPEHSHGLGLEHIKSPAILRLSYRTSLRKV